MKVKDFLKMLTLGLLVMACNKGYEDFPFLEEPEAKEPIEETVELGSISLNPILKDVIQIKTGKTLEEALDDMFVEIKKDEGLGWDYISRTEYRDLPAFIPLTPGTYTLLISNYSFLPSRFDDPVHGAQVLSFRVNAGLNTSLDLELALLGMAATINFSSDIMLSFPDIAVRAEFIPEGYGIGPNLTWNLAEDGRTGYLNTYQGDFVFDDHFFGNTGMLTLLITATDAAGSPVEITKTYSGVRANQHYHITIEQTAAATASLTVTLGDEDIINDTITFPYN